MSALRLDQAQRRQPTRACLWPRRRRSVRDEAHTAYDGAQLLNGVLRVIVGDDRVPELDAGELTVLLFGRKIGEPGVLSRSTRTRETHRFEVAGHFGKVGVRRQKRLLRVQVLFEDLRRARLHKHIARLQARVLDRDRGRGVDVEQRHAAVGDERRNG